MPYHVRFIQSLYLANGLTNEYRFEAKLLYANNLLAKNFRNK